MNVARSQQFLVYILELYRFLRAPITLVAQVEQSTGCVCVRRITMELNDSVIETFVIVMLTLSRSSSKVNVQGNRLTGGNQ